MGADDWKQDMIAASEKAKSEADAKTQKELDGISAGAAGLQQIADDLKLTDPETYNKLINIVDQATKNNEAIGDVVDKVKSLGKAGVKLAAGISSAGTLGALSAILKP